MARALLANGSLLRLVEQFLESDIMVGDLLMMKTIDKKNVEAELADNSDASSHKQASWSVYLIRTAANQLYCGVTTDVERRFKEHQCGKKGAKYLKGKGPLELAWSEVVGDKCKAMRLEYKIKQLTKAKKETIISQALQLDELLQ